MLAATAAAAADPRGGKGAELREHARVAAMPDHYRSVLLRHLERGMSAVEIPAVLGGGAGDGAQAPAGAG